MSFSETIMPIVITISSIILVIMGVMGVSCHRIYCFSRANRRIRLRIVVIIVAEVRIIKRCRKVE